MSQIASLLRQRGDFFETIQPLIERALDDANVPSGTTALIREHGADRIEAFAPLLKRALRDKRKLGQAFISITNLDIKLDHADFIEILRLGVFDKSYPGAINLVGFVKELVIQDPQATVTLETMLSDARLPVVSIAAKTLVEMGRRDLVLKHRKILVSLIQNTLAERDFDTLKRLCLALQSAGEGQAARESLEILRLKLPPRGQRAIRATIQRGFKPRNR
jgi:hypothetical protein